MANEVPLWLIDHMLYGGSRIPAGDGRVLDMRLRRNGPIGARSPRTRFF
jgi:hypothetical protein